MLNLPIPLNDGLFNLWGVENLPRLIVGAIYKKATRFLALLVGKMCQVEVVLSLVPF